MRQIGKGSILPPFHTFFFPYPLPEIFIVVKEWYFYEISTVLGRKLS